MPYYGSNTNAHFVGGVTGQDDGSFEAYQREQGGYQPGSFEQMQDQITQGSDDGQS
jgi:hypothetical protein